MLFGFVRNTASARRAWEATLAEYPNKDKEQKYAKSRRKKRGVAQLVARTVRDREAAGSNPVAPTILRRAVVLINSSVSSSNVFRGVA